MQSWLTRDSKIDMEMWSSTASNGSSFECAFEPKRGLGAVHGLVFFPDENNVEKTAEDVADGMGGVTRASWSLARMDSYTENKVAGQSFVGEPMGGVTLSGGVDGVEVLEDHSFEME